MTTFRSDIPITPEEAARHDAPTLPDDDAPPMTRWAVAGWMGLGAFWALVFGAVLAWVVQEVAR